MRWPTGCMGLGTVSPTSPNSMAPSSGNSTARGIPRASRRTTTTPMGSRTSSTVAGRAGHQARAMARGTASPSRALTRPSPGPARRAKGSGRGSAASFAVGTCTDVVHVRQAAPSAARGCHDVLGDSRSRHGDGARNAVSPYVVRGKTYAERTHTALDRNRPAYAVCVRSAESPLASKLLARSLALICRSACHVSLLIRCMASPA
jgi:hypothetical protein